MHVVARPLEMSRFRDKLSLRLRLRREASPSQVVATSQTAPEAAIIAQGVSSRQGSGSGKVSDSVISEDNPERLWDVAYDKLKDSQKHSELFDAYEKLVSGEIQYDQSCSENIIDPSYSKRHRHMEQLVQIGLDKTSKDATRKQRIHNGLEAIQPVKKAVDAGIKAAPEAAIA